MNNFLTFLLVFTSALSCLSQENRSLISIENIPTYGFSDPNPLPAFVYNSKIYPYFKFDGYLFNKKVKQTKVVALENDFIKVEILPEVGGKVWGAIDKSNGNEFIYKNDVLKFRNIAMRGPWTSGGIEFNFGIIGHHPGTATPVDYAIETLDDGTQVCTVGTIDLPSRTQWRVRIELPKNTGAFTTKTTWYNPTAIEKSYYNWMTAAAEAKQDLVFQTPGNSFLEHSGQVQSWPFDRLNRNLSHYDENNFASSKSYHVVGEYNDFFGGYYQNSDVGFGHWSRYDEIPGQKLWIWDLSRFGGIWEDLLTDTDGQYIEYQAGRLFVQYFPGEENPISQANFEPHRTDQWTEVWFPIKNTKGLSEASEWGAMNMDSSDGNLELYINSFIQTEGTIVFSQNDRVESIEQNFSPNQSYAVKFQNINPDAPYTITIKALRLYYQSTPRLIRRPFATPHDLKNLSTTARLFQKGLDAQRFRNFDEAESFFQEVLSNDPAHLEARQKMGELLHQKGQYNDAIKILNEGLSIDTYHPGLNFNIGIHYLALSDFDNALESLGWAAHSLTYRSAAYTHMAQIKLLQNDPDEAAHYAELALDFNSKNVMALVYAYLAQKQLQNKAKAKSLLQTIHKIDPLHHLISFEHFLEGALTKTELLAHHKSEFPYQTFLELALLYHNAGFDSEAIKVLENSPKNVLIQLWHNYLTQNNAVDSILESADVEFIFPFRTESLAMLKWLNTQSNHWKAKYLLGLNFMGTHQMECGRELLNELKQSPNWDLFYWIRGNINAALNPENTFNDFEKAYSLNSENWRIALHYARALNEQQNVKKGLSVLEKAYKKFPENYSIGMEITENLIGQKQFKKAISILETIQVLPYEHATGARETYTKAYLGAALEEIHLQQWKKATQLINTSLEWPERLGVGKPFDPEERIQHFLLAYTVEKQNGDGKEHLKMIADYSKQHLKKGGKNCLLGLYAIQLLEGNEAALNYAKQIEGGEMSESINQTLSYYFSHTINDIKESDLQDIVRFIKG